jgi:DNA-binding Lrp family transcriptional regulator
LSKSGIGVTWFKEFKPEKIDEIDKRILSVISLDARTSCVELGRKLKLTPRVVSYRIKDLIKRGIIVRFRLQVDSKKIGYSFYKAIIYLKDYTKNKDDKLRLYCEELGTVFHYERKLGPWMLELEMEVESFEKFNQILKEMKEKFPDFIKAYDGMLIYEEPKGELDISKVL